MDFPKNSREKQKIVGNSACREDLIIFFIWQSSGITLSAAQRRRSYSAKVIANAIVF
jgi:hypothetical protein